MARYQIFHFTFCDGWVPWEHDDEGTAVHYGTRELAEASIDGFMDDIQEQIASGEREPDEGYDRDEFEIREV